MFADFDTNEQDRVYLRRISFDGYGCCHVESTQLMNEVDSRNFIEWVEAGDVSHDKMRMTLSRYFIQVKDCVWADALVDHELISKSEER